AIGPTSPTGPINWKHWAYRFQSERPSPSSIQINGPIRETNIDRDPLEIKPVI
ncbi:15268_t:CDS:1, partial [Dentiscutata heterogama]